MSPQRIKIHQIYKAKSMEILLRHINGLLHPMDRALGFISFRNTLAHENIIDLTDGNHIQSCILHSIQRSRSKWLQCIIMTVAGSDKLAFFLTYIWSGNDTAYFPLVFHSQFSGDLTAAIQLI